MTFRSPFSGPKPTLIQIDQKADIIFVADIFAEQYAGGAELTTEALIKKSPVPVQKILSSRVTMELLKQGAKKHWVFGNFAGINFDLIPSIVANLSYSVLEYDFKYCRYRSPEKHKFAEQMDCDCENEQHGKMVSAFYYGAKSLWWMSEAQQQHYMKLFPFLSEKNNTVLSSVFDDEFFVALKELREKHKKTKRNGWIVLGSNSWIKGAEAAEKWCRDKKLAFEIVWNLPYAEVLEKLATAEGFVYLPEGMDTCPRMVIEAKLLGCKLKLNDGVQHQDEEWFATDSTLEIEEYLYASRDMFWQRILTVSGYQATISGYTTTRNCIEQGYPWQKSIASLLLFCDEVVVVDGGSTDGTWEMLQAWSRAEEKLHPTQIVRDWDSKRFAVFDGAQKAEARKLCTKDFCWQMDADEIVPIAAASRVIEFCRSWPPLVDLVSLPIVEFWGSEQKARIDVNPWKWRLSRNLPHITHGIPANLRKYDDDDQLYSAPGSDGCDYVHTETGEPIPHGTFYNEQAHHARVHAVDGNSDALSAYQGWMQNCVEMLPCVKHYSWMNLERKIRTYKNYWQTHWESLYDIKQEDTAENNMFFDKPWADVTDAEITALASRLANETGGHIFHTKIDWTKPMPSMSIEC
jgi:hypothetical protein